MDAAANPRYVEEAEALSRAASPGADQLGSERNLLESFASVGPPIEPLVDSSTIDQTLEVTPGEAVDGAVPPPSAVPSIDSEQEEPLPPSSLEDAPAGGGAPESQEQAALVNESVQQNTATVITETIPSELSEAGAEVDQDYDLLATPERAASPSLLPFGSDNSQSDKLETEQAPAGEEEAFGEEEAAGSLEAAEANAKDEFETASVGQTSEAAEGGDIGAEGEIGGEADGVHETQGEAVAGGVAEPEEAADRVVDAQQAALEEAATSAPEVVATYCTDDELVSESRRLEPPRESEEGQGEGLMPMLDLIEDPEKVQHTASGGKLETPKEEFDDEGKVKEEEDELQKKRRQESLMAARKKRLREQAVNQTAEEEERAREVVRRKLESLLQRDQTPRPSEPSPTGASVPAGSGVKPTAVNRVSDGAKAPARAAVGPTEKFLVPKRAQETRSPAVGVASPSAGATTATAEKNLARSSSPSAVVSPSHPVPAAGLTKAKPTRLEPPSHFASEARAGGGLRIDEHVKVVERDLDEGEDDLDEDEDYGDDEDDALFDDGDGDELAALVGSAPQQRSQSAKDQGAEAAAHAEAGSADKARKLAERKILLKMAKEASGISHSVSEDSDMKAWKRRAKLKNMESRRKQDVPTYGPITNAAARRRELDRVKKEKQKSKGSLRYKKAA